MIIRDKDITLITYDNHRIHYQRCQEKPEFLDRILDKIDIIQSSRFEHLVIKAHLFLFEPQFCFQLQLVLHNLKYYAQNNTLLFNNTYLPCYVIIMYVLKIDITDLIVVLYSIHLDYLIPRVRNFADYLLMEE